MHSALHALPVLQDNVVWIWIRGKNAVVVDPAVADPVQQWLTQRALCLIAILQTHHHDDHIGGTPKLLQYWPDAEVIAAAADHSRIPLQTISVSDGDTVNVLGRRLDVMDVAAHTSAHIAFVLQRCEDQDIGPLVFCGDTLFAGGCGRLFEGTPQDMHQALRRLAKLPDQTRVCCAHEYTEANLRWAIERCPEDIAITKRYLEVQALRRRGRLSLPSSIGLERRTNLFMQAKTAEQLADLRIHKDRWHSA
ncbi:hydroxyacylglutathione hydrolase [Synechococcus sp. M16CYN]|uniref:hydroxyacylglutathione hydrolase n=1 Tax=Synechococcus sp. M16CYN TaxID=3103139 RepID=UPI0032552B9C